MLQRLWPLVLFSPSVAISKEGAKRKAHKSSSKAVSETGKRWRGLGGPLPAKQGFPPHDLKCEM